MGERLLEFCIDKDTTAIETLSIYKDDILFTDNKESSFCSITFECIKFLHRGPGHHKTIVYFFIKSELDTRKATQHHLRPHI